MNCFTFSDPAHCFKKRISMLLCEKFPKLGADHSKEGYVSFTWLFSFLQIYNFLFLIFQRIWSDGDYGWIDYRLKYLKCKKNGRIGKKKYRKEIDRGPSKLKRHWPVLWPGKNAILPLLLGESKFFLFPILHGFFLNLKFSTWRFSVWRSYSQTLKMKKNWDNFGQIHDRAENANWRL